ncbi:hypothetical protein HK097_009173 [Rhizophlyctis rosea]|uniref:GIY-YIG domain-containing protein n=1 Tax=Rhizophlyctis rosea TaxID=64517 RepID=A0AAD5X940_9FUNG|nr:hypothetical protein HK097_009173 [Rhizophlyctis rosea]
MYQGTFDLVRSVERRKAVRQGFLGKKLGRWKDTSDRGINLMVVERATSHNQHYVGSSRGKDGLSHRISEHFDPKHRAKWPQKRLYIAMSQPSNTYCCLLSRIGQNDQEFTEEHVLLVEAIGISLFAGYKNDELGKLYVKHNLPSFAERLTAGNYSGLNDTSNMEAVGTLQQASLGGQRGILAQRAQDPLSRSALEVYHSTPANRNDTSVKAAKGWKRKELADQREEFKRAFVAGVPVHIGPPPPSNGQWQFKWLRENVSPSISSWKPVQTNLKTMQHTLLKPFVNSFLPIRLDQAERVILQLEIVPESEIASKAWISDADTSTLKTAHRLALKLTAEKGGIVKAQYCQRTAGKKWKRVLEEYDALWEDLENAEEVAIVDGRGVVLKGVSTESKRLRRGK